MRLGALPGPSAFCTSSLARSVAACPPASSFLAAPGRRREGGGGSRGERSSSATTSSLAMPSPSSSSATAAATAPDSDPLSAEDESSTASLVADAVTWASTHGMVRVSEGEKLFLFFPQGDRPTFFTLGSLSHLLSSLALPKNITGRRPLRRSWLPRSLPHPRPSLRHARAPPAPRLRGRRGGRHAL